MVKRVRGSRIESVGSENYKNKDERVDPGVSEREGFPASEETFRFSPF